MAFHVDIATPEEDGPGPADVLAAVRDLEHFQAPDAAGDRFLARYANPRTRVVLELAYDRAGVEGGAPFRLVMRYLRPSFHGRELEEVAAALAERLGLPAPGGVAERFAAENAAEVRARREQLAAKGAQPLVLSQWLPRERSDAWWRWQRRAPALREAHGDALVLPGILLLRPEGASRLVTAVAWSDAAAIVLPEVDRLFLMRGVQGGQAQDVALVDAAAAREELADLLEPLPGEPDLLHLPGARAMQAQAWFQGAEGLPGVDAFEQVAPDAFTDVPPDGVPTPD